jgi:RimJ/RimL family protein N-acetyltransferase
MSRATAVCVALLVSWASGYAQDTPAATREGSTMKAIGTKRFVLRAFEPTDWPDVHQLAIDWSKAPGPAFDKWPTDEAGAKGLTDMFTKSSKYVAAYLRQARKVVGLIALNNTEAGNRLDLGHVFLSKHQDNDLDKEALGTMVDYVFASMDIAGVVTHNASDHAAQLAPLKALGFRNVNKSDPGELVLTKAEWEQARKK